MASSLCSRFLTVIDARVPKKKTVHVIVDNYAAHKHPKVLEWIDKHPRFLFHFTPTSASWLNAVEGFFAKLTKKRLKRGVFRSLQELKVAIHRSLDDTNANPKPFSWTKDPNKIIASRQTRAPTVRFDPLAPKNTALIGRDELFNSICETRNVTQRYKALCCIGHFHPQIVITRK